MKTYICDQYTFYWSISKKLREKIVGEIGEGKCWVPCCAWNILYSIYEDDTMSNQIAEVYYRPGDKYSNPDKWQII